MVKLYLIRVYFNLNSETNPAKQMWIKASRVEQITPLMVKMYGKNFRKYEIVQQLDK